MPVSWSAAADSWSSLNLPPNSTGSSVLKSARRFVPVWWAEPVHSESDTPNGERPRDSDETRREGRIRAYGWSTDEPELAAAWVGQQGFGGLEFEINVVHDSPAIVDICERNDVPGLARGPLGTGLLTGAHPEGSRITDEQDFRRRSPDWLNYFQDGHPVPELARALESVRHILTSEGRTVAQGALAWLWARSPSLIPIPGAQTVAQVRENAGAMEKGPLSEAQMREIDDLLGVI
ncbi:aldo/keto reductase [Streptomyces sp. NPDC057740]|uniref:aldo/keto reductase n=1 Tax=Streptomyces sp. NPDC057740 TaxID=3346234 RepID=UPI0036A589D8